MSQEDELAQSIIDELDEKDEYELEVHYNHYGDRGAVDLVKIERFEGESPSITIYELKSEYALNQVTGANEIIRQFKHQQRYFFDGAEYNRCDYSSINYRLHFFASKDTVKHLRDNQSLYLNVVNRPDYASSEAFSLVAIQHPDVEYCGWPLKEYDGEEDWVGQNRYEDVLGDSI